LVHFSVRYEKLVFSEQVNFEKKIHISGRWRFLIFAGEISFDLIRYFGTHQIVTHVK